MTRVSSTPGAVANSQSFSTTDAINDLDLGTFLELMIAELQNQDPLNPLDNKDMLAQISQIREVGATDKLTKTLDSVLLGQNIASATNLIGADVTALSDDGEKVEGIVEHVSIDKGTPKLQVQRDTEATASSADGNIDAGTYAYRIVWENDRGELFGIDLSGDKAVTTTGTKNDDRAITIANLPATTNRKEIYRTDETGQGAYQLVGVLNDGAQASFVDTLSDDERSEALLEAPFRPSAAAFRAYQVSLNNISGIRPPGVPAATDDDELTSDN